jgi:hypothetical protein
MIRHLWQVVGGDVRVAVDEAEWWGASLSALIAAVHHPAALATCRPESDPVEVARDVLADVDDLYAAAAVAEAQARRADPGDRPASVSVRRDGAEIVFAPGAEVANLAWCLELFASAVVDPGGADAAAAQGATAYAASAWSVDIGRASGTLSAVDPPRQRGTSSEPAAVNRSHDRRAASESRSAPVSALRPRPGGRVVRVGSRLVRSGRARSSTPPCLMGAEVLACPAGGRGVLGGGERVQAVVPEPRASTRYPATAFRRPPLAQDGSRSRIRGGDDPSGVGRAGPAPAKGESGRCPPSRLRAMPC